MSRTAANRDPVAARGLALEEPGWLCPAMERRKRAVREDSVSAPASRVYITNIHA